MSELSVLGGGGPVESPSIDLDIETLEHNGVKISVLYERHPAGESRFSGVIAHDRMAEGYANAVVDYMMNVVGLSMAIASDIWNREAVRHAKSNARSERITRGSVENEKEDVVTTQHSGMSDDEYLAALDRERKAFARRNAAAKKPNTPQGEHINADGEFQSDKYPWCKPGFVPLKLSDPTAWPVLWHYADRREAVDAEFSADLRTCLRAKGYTPLERK